MSFKLDNFGSDSSNAKSTLGGVRYYRYYNKNSDTITTAGYFPAELGLDVGDRIAVIPSSKTEADEFYVVTSIANRKVVVTNVQPVPPAPISSTATLDSANWSDSSQTVTVSGVTADNIIFVSPAPASAADYASAGIICTAQATNSLTFTCESTPNTNISVNIVIM